MIYNIIYLCITIIMLFLIFKIKREHYNENNEININIGNHLTNYFCNLGLCILEKKDFHMNMNSNINFIKYFPSNIPYDFDNIHEELVKKGVKISDLKKNRCFTLWFIYDDTVMNFWMCMKDLIHNMIDNALRKSDLYMEVKEPLIHFRCADAPFVKNIQYHFVKYEFYKNALEKIYEKSPSHNKKVVILSCNTHRSNDKMKDSCIKYTDYLVDYLKDNGYEPDLQCDTNLNDFARMFYAPGVISIGSSYSFLAGFFGSGNFISSEHVMEHEKERKCTICDSWMLEGRVKHKDIPDYYDYETVNEILLN